MRYIVILIAFTTFSLADFVRIWAGGNKQINQPNGYNHIWLMAKTFIPLVPNIRIEHTSSSVPNQEYTTQDIIGYYNLLDNTFWTTIDFGLGASIDSKQENTFLGFARARLQVPLSTIGFEAIIKNNILSPSQISEMVLKADIDLFNIPLMLDIGLEAGYKQENTKPQMPDTENKQESYFIGVVAKF